jgi:hypothetical protein
MEFPVQDLAHLAVVAIFTDEIACAHFTFAVRSAEDRIHAARVLLHIDELATPFRTAAQCGQALAQHGFGLVLRDRQSEWIGRRQAAEVGDQESAGRRADHQLRRPQAVLEQQRRGAQWFEREQRAGVQHDRPRAVLTSLGLVDQHRLDAAAREGDGQCEPGRTCADDEDGGLLGHRRLPRSLGGFD